MTKPIVVIHGPQASGKTQNSHAFRVIFECDRIVELDDANFRGNTTLLQPGDLVLTNQDPVWATTRLDCMVVPIAYALQRLLPAHERQGTAYDSGAAAHELQGRESLGAVLTDSDVDEDIKREGDPVECRMGDWGFWDETWSDWRGGYTSEAEARMALRDYCTDFLEFHPARDPFRVSTVWATPDGDKNIAYLARVSNPKAQPNDPGTRLIGFLLRNHHWSPFEMASLCLEIRTQRDISAQICRHRSFSFQEFSTRYADVEDLLAVVECRFQDDANKQNSFSLAAMAEMNSNENEETVAYFDAVVNETRTRSLEAYQELRRRGVAKEVARRILPIGLIPTKMYMTGTVRSWLHYCAERVKPGVQKEHRLIAIHVLQQLWLNFPMVVIAASEAGLFNMSDEDREYYENLEPKKVQI